MEQIELTNSSKVSDATLLAIAESCKRLKYAHFSRLLNIHNAAIIHIAENCPDLQSINIIQCFNLNGSTSGVMSIIQNCRNMIEFNLGNSETVTDEVLAAIADAYGSQLQKLNLWVVLASIKTSR